MWWGYITKQRKKTMSRGKKEFKKGVPISDYKLFFISFWSKSLLLLFSFSLILIVTHFRFCFFLSQENWNRKEVEGHSICTHCALKFDNVEELKTHALRMHKKYKFAWDLLGTWWYLMETSGNCGEVYGNDGKIDFIQGSHPP